MTLSCIFVAVMLLAAVSFFASVSWEFRWEASSTVQSISY